jgi:maltose O-acetyltransferase
MTELDKLENGEWYYFLDDEVVRRKARAAKLC